MKIRIERAARAEMIFVEGAEQRDILPGSFRNFRGEKRRYNDEGKRNFNLALNFPQEELDKIAETGLRIKELPARDEEYDEPLRFVKVNVALGGKVPPQLFLVSPNGKLKELNQNELGLLDGARFSNVDLVIRTYHRDENTTSLYLQKGYFTFEQDPISAKYANYDEGNDEEDEIPFD